MAYYFWNNIIFGNFRLYSLNMCEIIMQITTTVVTLILCGLICHLSWLSQLQCWTAYGEG